MKVIKAYCGKAIIETNGTYALVDLYSYEITAKGTLAECEKALDKYIKEITDK